MNTTSQPYPKPHDWPRPDQQQQPRDQHHSNTALKSASTISRTLHLRLQNTFKEIDKLKNSMVLSRDCVSKRGLLKVNQH